MPHLAVLAVAELGGRRLTTDLSMHQLLVAGKRVEKEGMPLQGRDAGVFKEGTLHKVLF